VVVWVPDFLSRRLISVLGNSPRVNSPRAMDNPDINHAGRLQGARELANYAEVLF